MPELVKKLKPFDLMKVEVLNLINVGIGVRATQPQGDANNEDEDEPDQEAEISRDIQFFKVIVEEADERFPGEEGEERIREVISIMRDTTNTSENADKMNGVELNGVDGISE